MKQANNNEVDLLLRSLASARAESSPQAEVSGDEADPSYHLDADELNSYSEGLVPANARARYLEHLADCAACRGIVVGLTQAAGFAHRYEAVEQKGSLGFWQKLGTIFSPRVLRYALPASVLTAVIGISLLALRQPRRPELIARNEQADSRTLGNQTKESPTAPATAVTPTTNSRAGDSRVTLNSIAEESKTPADKGRVGQAPVTTGGESERASAQLKDATKAGEGAGLAGQRPADAYASEPKAAAPSVTFQGEADSLMAKEQAAKREDQSRQRDNAFRVQPSDEHGPYRSSAPTAGAMSARRVEGLSAGRTESNTNEKKAKGADDNETRSVSGRRFARSGDAWVDTAYDSSRATINVVRGSEQFRALVADEPELGVIAKKLNGVVIVVWKNRAYRIQ